MRNMSSARWILYVLKVVLYDSDVDSKCTMSADFGIELLGNGKRLRYVQAFITLYHVPGSPHSDPPSGYPGR